MTTSNQFLITMISVGIALGSAFCGMESAEAHLARRTAGGGKVVVKAKGVKAKVATRSKASRCVVRKLVKPDPTRIIASTKIREDKVLHKKYVALTFDDGPSPEYTPQVLKTLKDNGLHAVFCLVGLQVKKYPELVKQIVEDGHKVANHSMNHCESLTRCSDKKLTAEILGDKELIQSVVPGTPVEYYRAPGGDWNRRVRAYAVSCGMKPLGWSVDTKDWQTPGEDAIVKTVTKYVRPGAVILMHDAGGNRSQSVAALKEIIPQLKKAGYEFAFPAS